LAPARSAGLLVVLALAPLWLVGMFGRGLWTPDEPREADIAWRMSQQSDRTLPQLAAVPFLEKPPLSYWMSAAALGMFGDSARAARAPNLLYAVIAALSVAALALAMQADAAAAVIAAVVAMSALTAFRVTVWLAPDACLLAGCALALLGAWRGYRAARGAVKASGYALMHFGAAVGFMAKSAPGWLVPALALLALIAWERRWQELRRWELYAGLVIQAAIICPWLLAVVREPQAGEILRALFWYNLMGRFARVASPLALDYASGHRNSPGKYLLELPLYLLPWTLIVAVALVRAWRRVRGNVSEATAWRFALCASVPFLVLLSVAATARDIYAAPALLGFGVLAGLWAHEAPHSAGWADHLALRLSRYLIALIAWTLAAGLAVLAAAGAARLPASLTAALAVIVLAHGALLLAGRAERAGNFSQSLGWLYGGYAAPFCIAALIALPIIDRWQDLPELARRIHADTAHAPLALLNPDETTIAMLDFRLETPFTILTSSEAAPGIGAAGAEAGMQQLVDGWFETEGPGARVLVLLPGHAAGAVTLRLKRLLPRAARDDGGDGIAGTLIGEGRAVLVQRYELPQGRRYALLGPPP
jgi:4-amino-4-deoxy-L-arabinose transferase-like glycosyltransferase